jgi:hypothetical protein
MVEKVLVRLQIVLNHLELSSHPFLLSTRNHQPRIEQEEAEHSNKTCMNLSVYILQLTTKPSKPAPVNPYTTSNPN